MQIVDAKIDKFARPIGQEATVRAIDSYRKGNSDFRPEYKRPMQFASGYTTGWLAIAFAEQWIQPLEKKAQKAIIAALSAMFLMLFAIAYSWSTVSFVSFQRFLVAFVPGVIALLYSIAKAYKTWAEARKTLAEAFKIRAEAKSEVGTIDEHTDLHS